VHGGFACERGGGEEVSGMPQWHCPFREVVFRFVVVPRTVASPRGVSLSHVSDSSGEVLRVGRHPARRAVFLVV